MSRGSSTCSLKIMSQDELHVHVPTIKTSTDKKTNYTIFHPDQKHLNYDVNIKILDNRVNNILTLNVKNMSNI